MAFTRRELVRTGATIVTVAGATGVAAADATDRTRSRRQVAGAVDSRDRSQTPGYANWIPAPSAVSDSRMVEFVYGGTARAAIGAYNNQSSPSDPLLVNPSTFGGFSYLAWLGLVQLGIYEPVIGPAPEEGTRDPANVPTDRTLVVGGETQVYLGSFDTQALQSAVDAGAFSDAGDGTYAHDEQQRFVTWTDGAVVVGTSADFVNAVLAAGTGDAPSRHQSDDDWAWLLERAGTDGLMYAYHSEDSSPAQIGEQEDTGNMNFSMFEGSTGVAQSVTVDDASFTDATAAVLYPSADAVSTDRLESALGTGADGVAVRRDGPRVTVNATYDGSQPETVDAGPATDGGGGSTPGSGGSGDGGGGDGGGGDGGNGGDGESSGDGGNGGGNGGDEGDGSGDGSSGFGPGMGVVAALASLTGGGYLLSRRSDGES